MSRKSIITGTSFLLGAVIFILLAFLPAFKDLILIKKNLNDEFLNQIPEQYTKQGIPEIVLDETGFRANNDSLFYRSWPADKSGDFSLYIHTAEVTDPLLVQKIREGAGGVLILRDKIVVYNANQRKEQTIPLPEKVPFKFTLNKDTVERYSLLFGKGLIIAITSAIIIFNFLNNAILLLITALILSGKSKTCGGGNYSVALWSLVPPTILKLFLDGGCLRCSMFYVIFIIAAVIFAGKMQPLKIEE